MRRSLLTLGIAGGALAVATALIASQWKFGPATEERDVRTAPTVGLEANAGICPWRDPEVDRKRFFPTATRIEDETFILSGQRIEITQRLGHTPGSADSVLRAHQAFQANTSLGYIVTRAVRGESGVIEQVLAVGTDGKVIGARLQRLREPDAVTQALQSPAWLGAYTGKTAASAWQIGVDLPAIDAAARISAEALAQNARTTLVLLEVGRSLRHK